MGYEQPRPWRDWTANSKLFHTKSAEQITELAGNAKVTSAQVSYQTLKVF